MLNTEFPHVFVCQKDPADRVWLITERKQMIPIKLCSHRTVKLQTLYVSQCSLVVLLIVEKRKHAERRGGSQAGE